MLSGLPLRLRIFLFFALMGLGSAAIIALSLGYAASRDSDIGSALATGGVLAAFLTLGLILFVWRLFDENIARAIDRLATEMRARAHSEVNRDLDAAPARYLGDLAPAAGAIAGTLQKERRIVEETVARTTAQLQAETERLTALLADVQAGLLLCAPEHTLVFYNAPAVEMLRDTGRPRLDRSVFDLLRAPPIQATYRRLIASEGAEKGAELLVTTTGCGKSLSAHMRLVSGALGLGEVPGYVLTLRDVTDDLRLHTDRARMLRDTIEGLRQPAAALGAQIELYDETGGTAPASGIVAEARRLVDEVAEVATRYDNARETWWPMQEVRASHIIDGLRGQIGEGGPTLDAPSPHMLLRCDGFALTGLLSALVEEVHGRGLTRALSLEVDPEGDGACLTLAWPGDTLPLDALEALLDRPIPDSALDLTGREVLDQHGTEIWPERLPDGRAALRLPIAEARPTQAMPERKGHLAERPAVYDFGLLNRSRDTAKAGRALSDLTYVVFDTETTGLEPQGGDEVVQIAAVRVMNGRIVEGEVIDQLVDPERSIPPGATKVHGVSEDMVRGMPRIREAGARFHRFCDNAVLVAHNAPFDMAFFHRHAADIGASFDHPVFDTVLLSAILFGQQEQHTLDALAERFGVVIPEADRHTAYGDTVATAQVFLRMLPMLEARGLSTFDAVMDEMQKNSRLMREMKARVGA